MPSIIINIISGLKKGKLFLNASQILISLIDLKFWKKCEYLLLYCTDFIPIWIENLQTMSLGYLSLYHIYRIPLFIINIITVKPRKQSLFKIHSHTATSVHFAIFTYIIASLP